MWDPQCLSSNFRSPGYVCGGGGVHTWELACVTPKADATTQGGVLLSSSAPQPLASGLWTGVGSACSLLTLTSYPEGPLPFVAGSRALVTCPASQLSSGTSRLSPLASSWSCGHLKISGCGAASKAFEVSE